MHALTRSQAVAVFIMMTAQLSCGLLALRATFIHVDAYPSQAQWWAEVFAFSAVCLSGLGILRQRPWALWISRLVLYLAFFCVLIAISLAFDNRHAHWWYWLLPFALPLIGWLLHVLRCLRQKPQTT